MASKLSILSLVVVGGRWLITDSVSHRTVVNELSKCSILCNYP